MYSDRNKLPRNHEEYEYPPSKNPYSKKILESKPWAFSDADTERNAGQWKQQFQASTQTDQELWVELGCNTGHVIRAWAKSNPNTRFIGLESKFKAVFRGVEKAQQAELSNLIFLRAHGERLPQIFAPAEIDRLFLFFPDPWPPKSQWKKRLFKKGWLEAIAPLLKKDAIFEIRTDHDGYFEWMLEQVEGLSQYDVVQIERNKHQNHPNPAEITIPNVTLFERLFIKDGIPIKQLILKKK